MNWSKLFHLEIGSLLKGKIQVYEPVEKVPYKRRISLFCRLRFSIARFIRSVFTFKRKNLINLTFNLSQITATNMPLAEAIEMLIPEAPTLRLNRVLRRLLCSLEKGLSLSEAMRQQPRFFPGYYINLVETGEKTGSLEMTLRDLEELLLQNRALYQTALFSYGYLSIVSLVILLISMFIGLKIYPVFFEILNDLGIHSSENLSYVAGVSLWLINQAGKLGASARLYAWIGVGFFACIAVWWLPRLDRILLRLGRMNVPGLHRVSCKVWWVANARILSRLMQAGYPLDESLAMLLQWEKSWTFRKMLQRLHTSISVGHSFYRAIEAEKRHVPSSLRDLAYVGETSGRLPQALLHISHFYHAQLFRTVVILGDIVFPIAIVGLGCLVMSVYCGVYAMNIELIDALINSL